MHLIWFFPFPQTSNICDKHIPSAGIATFRYFCKEALIYVESQSDTERLGYGGERERMKKNGEGKREREIEKDVNGLI